MIKLVVLTLSVATYNFVFVHGKPWDATIPGNVGAGCIPLRKRKP